jgi:hypothetical protein
MRVCWYRSYSCRGKISEHLISCEVPEAEGRHWCPTRDETEGRVFLLGMSVDVARWSRGWILRPYFHPYYTGSQEYEDPEAWMPESWGFAWLFLEGQQEGFTWLEFDDSGTGSLSHPYQLTTRDGRLVRTPVGLQIDPQYRCGVSEPEEALSVSWFCEPLSRERLSLNKQENQ